MVAQKRYHIHFNNRRTTITVDSIISELLAVKLGLLPDAPGTHSTVRDWLEKTLGSRQRMKTLIRKEIQADAKEYGDERRSPIVSRWTAEAFNELELAPSEPVTVVLSEKGWARSDN